MFLRTPLSAYLVLACVLGGAPARAEPALLNVSARPGVDLNGSWHVIVDPYETGYYDYRREPYDAAAKPTGGYFLDRKPADKSELIEYDFDHSPVLKVPGDWNSQNERLFYYEGSVWYRRRFDCPAGNADRRLFLYFGAANYQADVYLNGKKLGRHIGGFTPFEFEVTGLVQERDNSLVVRVDNARHPEAVPTVNTDWWNYGGLTRDVRLVETPATFIRTYGVQLKKSSPGRLEGSVRLDGKQRRQHVTLTI